MNISLVSLVRFHHSSPVLLRPGPSALTLAASCEGSTFILKGLMGISCFSIKGERLVKHLVSPGTCLQKQFTCVCSHLVSEKHHDGVLTGTWRHVLHCERVIIVLDDVEVDVGLRRSDHTWSTLDPNAHITWEIK